MPYSQRTGALRFGDQRAMALAGAPCRVVHAVTGFTNKSLRRQVAGLLGRDYSSSQMSYDLRRSRLHGLIEREPTPIPSLQMGSESPLLAPSCTLACSVHSSTATNPLHLSSFAGPSPQSSACLATTSRTRDLESLPKICHKSQRPVVDQEEPASDGTDVRIASRAGASGDHDSTCRYQRSPLSDTTRILTSPPAVMAAKASAALGRGKVAVMNRPASKSSLAMMSTASSKSSQR